MHPMTEMLFYTAIPFVFLLGWFVVWRIHAIRYRRSKHPDREGE